MTGLKPVNFPNSKVDKLIMKFNPFSRQRTHQANFQQLYTRIDRLLESARQLFSQSESLKRVVATEKEAVQKSSSAAYEISSMVGKTADAAAELSRMAVESHRAVDNSANALKSLNAMIENVDGNSKNLQESVKTGLTAIASVTETMAEIRNKAKIINEIVFQTKLLSFNASVEAARAGEHGKGFAVVAEEMANLAKASGDAAEQIESILTSSVERTKQQIESVTSVLERAARETIDAVAAVSAKSGEIAAAFGQLENYSKITETRAHEISSATSEQKIGVDEISKSLQKLESSSGELDAMAVTSNGSSAEMAAIVESITAQFLELSKALGMTVTKEEKPFDFTAAISAHIDWKMKLSKYLNHPDGSLDPKKVGLDNACVLGKWLYGDGLKFESANPGLFQSVRNSHAEFHRTAAEIIGLINSGNQDEARRLLGPSGPYLEISKKTVDLIGKLQAEVETIKRAG